MGRVVFLDEGGVLTGGQQLRQLKQVRVNILAGYSVSGLEGNMLKYWSVEWISEQ
jgi:predicted ATP-grasp superfamily ATP-dependent carboligase